MAAGDHRVKKGGSVDNDSASESASRSRPPLSFKRSSKDDLRPHIIVEREAVPCEDVRSLIQLSSACIACFTFDQPLSTSQSAQDLIEHLYVTPSKCVEASLKLALFLDKPTTDDVIGMPLGEVLPRALGYEKLFLRWHEQFLSGQMFDIDVLAPDASPIVMQSVVYGRIVDDHFARIWLVLRDVTVHTRASLVSQTAAGIAHDLNNYLTVIQGQVEKSLEHTDPNHPSHLSLRETQDAIVACSKLARQLLNVGRDGQQQREQRSVASILQDAVAICKHLVTPSITLQATHCEEDLLIECSPLEMQQALINLILNARDALNGNGMILLSASPIPPADGQSLRQVAIIIRDNGSGIAEQHIERIFEPYFTTKSARGGTGLGLSNVRASIEAQGGRIEVRSKEGVGTEFHLIFPLMHSALWHVSLTPDRSLSVLVADDDEGVRNILLSNIARMGHRPYGVSDGQALLAMLQEGMHTYDAIIVDDSMPKARGLDLVPRIHSLAPNAEIILTSGDPRIEAASARLNPAPLFLAKPFGLDELSKALANKRRLSEIPR
jgi:signal transduction histidine kinase/CheY-like chemotaxis protein